MEGENVDKFGSELWDNIIINNYLKSALYSVFS